MISIINSILSDCWCFLVKTFTFTNSTASVVSLIPPLLILSYEDTTSSADLYEINSSDINSSSGDYDYIKSDMTI